MFKVVTIVEIICFTIECLCATYLNALWPVIFAVILGIIIFSMLRAVITINGVIAKLKERKGETSCQSQNRRPSPLLAAGLLLNACALLIDDGISSYIKTSVQILAIILMLIGLYQTRYIFYKD